MSTANRFLPAEKNFYLFDLYKTMRDRSVASVKYENILLHLEKGLRIV